MSYDCEHLTESFKWIDSKECFVQLVSIANWWTVLYNCCWWTIPGEEHKMIFSLFFSQTMPKINREEVSKSHLRNEQLLYSNRRKQEKNPEGLHFFCCCSYLLFISVHYIFFQHKWQRNKNL